MRAGRRNSHSEHEALREMKNELMAQWDGIRSGAASFSGPRIMVRYLPVDRRPALVHVMLLAVQGPAQQPLFCAKAVAILRHPSSICM
jgi:hypothetical protein